MHIHKGRDQINATLVVYVAVKHNCFVAFYQDRSFQITHWAVAAAFLRHLLLLNNSNKWQ